MDDFMKRKSYKELSEETGWAVDRMKSLVRHHNLPTDYEKRPGQSHVVVLPEDTENFIRQHILRSEARKGKLKEGRPRVLAFINQKGGVGKTSCAYNTAAALSMEGYSVSYIDADPQAHGTKMMLGYGGDEINCIPLWDVMRDNSLLSKSIMKGDKFDMIPSNFTMNDVEQRFSDPKVINKVYMIKNIIQKLNYDFVVIDGPPSLGYMAINVMMAADHVIVPVQTSALSLSGLKELMETIRDFEKQGETVNLLGAVLNMAEMNTILKKEVSEMLKADMGDKIFDTVVRRSIKVEECKFHCKDIYDYAPESNVADDFKMLTDEILKKIGVEK